MRQRNSFASRLAWKLRQIGLEAAERGWIDTATTVD